MNNETVLIIGKGAWAKGRTIAEAVAALPRKVKARDNYEVRLIFWRDDEAREKARSFDEYRANERLPSWVEPDGAPFVEVDDGGVVSRAGGTSSASLTTTGRWTGTQLLAAIDEERERMAGAQEIGR